MELVFSSAATGERLNLTTEGEDLLIAVVLNLLKDAMVLDANLVLEDILDAEHISED